MSFTRNLPEWKAEGIEPSETQKQTGFQPGMKPPAQWFNWVFNWTYLALKELQEKAAEKSIVDTAIEDIQEDVLQNQEYAEQEFSKLFERLDTSESKEVTLQSGLQVIQGKRNAPFNLNSIKGRTLVNLLGRVGGGEQLPSIDSSNAATLSVDTSTKDTGLSSYKVTANNDVANAEHYIDLAAVSIKAGSFYVAIGMVKPATNATTSILAYGTNAGGELDFVIPSDSMSVTSVFSPAVVLFKSTIAVKARIRLRVQNAAGDVIYTPNGEYANFDSIRLYEVNETEYAALANMPLNQIAAKYPYVDSVQPVRNPYAIRYGENLLPPFYEWALPTGAIINAPYSLTCPYTSGTTAYNTVDLPAIPGQTYTLTVNNNVANARNVMNFYDASGTKIDGTIVSGTVTPVSAGVNTVTYQAPAGAKTMRMYLYGDPEASGTATFSNPMLNIGTTTKPFKPREDAMLALQTDLFADPLTGANADEVFEKEGQYFKLAKWKRIVPDDSFTYGYFTSYAGGKSIFFMGFIPKDRDMTVYPMVLKYDGKLLTPGGPSVAGNIDYFSTTNWATSTATSLGISVSSADSGWGDAYTPTADEIKAYFMGWKMYDVTVSSSGQGVYNGSGAANKRWAYRADGVSQAYTGGTATLPTTQAPNYTPYQLVYQLATPIVEPITSEGQLTLIEGNNQVEVGTGIVLREYTPAAENTINTVGRREINYTPVPTSLLKAKARDILAIYKNGAKDDRWAIGRNVVDAYGTARANLVKEAYDPSAAYTVTYLMLETSPTTPFVGSVPENEKALLTNLVQDVQQANARISVVESKKAEKHSPAWITPTLLNSWVRHSTARPTLRYYKDSLGVVHLEGVIRSGVVTSGTALCNLPVGYRPALTVSCVSYSSNGTTVGMGLIDVLNDGTLQLGTTGTPTFYNGLMFISLSFLAEQ